jgi:hypothetical protein
MDQRFRLKESGGRRGAEAWGFPVQLEGDSDLCQRISGYLHDPVPALTQSLDPQTGERGTRVITLAPGDPGWLVGCLRRAAQELGLHLTEVPLGGK